MLAAFLQLINVNKMQNGSSLQMEASDVVGMAISTVSWTGDMMVGIWDPLMNKQENLLSEILSLCLRKG